MMDIAIMDVDITGAQQTAKMVVQGILNNEPYIVTSLESKSPVEPG